MISNAAQEKSQRLNTNRFENKQKTVPLVLIAFSQNSPSRTAIH